VSLQVQQQVGLSDLTWWKVGGLADHFVSPSNEKEIGQALLWASEKGHPVTVLGGGSNVLISDAGVEGLVISLKNYTGVEARQEDGRLVVVATSGSSKAEVLRHFLKSKLAPALFLCGLPGDMGGGVVMNAGVSEKITPREFHEIIDWFEVLREENGKLITQCYKNSDVEWKYRKSEGWQPGVITRIQVSWDSAEDPDIPTKVKSATRSRLARQPLNFPSGGSVFKNPVGRSSGALIDQSGLKGYTVGGAQVSEKHANFIVNLGDATAKDVKSVIDYVRQTVQAEQGIELETEVKLIGRW